MKKLITLQLFKSFSKVNFYTFKYEEDRMTETDKFFSKFEHNENIGDDLNNITLWLSLLGNKYGAKIEFFRHEASAQALPPPMPKMVREVIVNDLRLYCVCITEEIVILANGDIKIAQTVQDSANVLPHFRFANAVSKQINDLMREGVFKHNGKYILNLNEIELIY